MRKRKRRGRKRLGLCLLVAGAYLWSHDMHIGWPLQWQEKVRQITQQREKVIQQSQEPPELMVTLQEMDLENRYAYEQLSKEEQEVYKEILSCILAHEPKIRVSTLDEGMIEQVYQAVCADYGGLYWVSGYVYTTYSQGDEIVSIEFQPKYTMKKEEREQDQAQIDAVVVQFLSGITEEMSDYQKVRHVYENLIREVDYEQGVENDQNILSVFLNRRTVCQGYASATQYLLEKLGIQCALVTGTAGNDTHAWNLVRMDGAYYYVDVTWGNSAYLDASKNQRRYINYNYLGMTTKELNRTHQLNVQFPLPECTSDQDNYYVQEDCYITQEKEREIEQKVRQAWQEQREGISLKAADDEIYARMRKVWIEQKKILDVCGGLQTFYYMEDPAQRILSVYFQT